MSQTYSQKYNVTFFMVQCVYMPYNLVLCIVSLIACKLLLYCVSTQIYKNKLKAKSTFNLKSSRLKAIEIESTELATIRNTERLKPKCFNKRYSCCTTK